MRSLFLLWNSALLAFCWGNFLFFGIFLWMRSLFLLLVAHARKISRGPYVTAAYNLSKRISWMLTNNRKTWHYVIKADILHAKILPIVSHMSNGDGEKEERKPLADENRNIVKSSIFHESMNPIAYQETDVGNPTKMDKFQKKGWWKVEKYIPKLTNMPKAHELMECIKLSLKTI